MMSERRDLTGAVYGWLTVERFAHINSGNRQAYWHCKCRCGAEKDVRGTSLTQGLTVSCGCRKKDKEANRARSMARPKAVRVATAKKGAEARWRQ